MLTKAPYKVKTQTKDQQNNLNAPRFSTQYNKKKSSQIKNKLTKGCKKYDQIKDAYLKQGDKIKTDYNQCTFQPRLSSKKKQQRSRSFKKFIEDQQNYQHNKNNKIKQFKTQVNKAQITQCTNRPSIDKISQRICTLMNYDKQEVVQRLYKRKVIQQYHDDQELFSPKILPRSKSLRRSQNISDLLHSDALRRKQKKQVQEIQKQIQIPASPHILNNTYKLVCNKLHAQFCQLCPEDEKIIPLVMVWTIVSQIFGIDLNPNKQGRSGKICQQITKFLCRNGEEEVQRQKLWDFIQVIIMKNQAKSKNFADQINQIIDSFGNLYTCRIARPRAQKSPQQYPFFPQTLRSSESKAQKYRQKMLQQARQFLQNQNSKFKMKQQLSIQDMLSIDYLRRKASQQKRKLNNQKQMMKQCTFQPKLSESYSKPVFMPPRAVTNSKISSSKNTLMKSVSSQSLSQSFMSSTLKPLQIKSNIKADQKQQKVKQSHNKSVNQIKNVQKSILRMTIARKDRQLSNQIKNRGYPKNIQNWIQYTQHQKNQINHQHQKFKGLNYKKVSLR